tara:strand:- start:19882 stop:20109 length:228 start_codon:yes stop_codon:yes gene_type:complete
MRFDLIKEVVFSKKCPMVGHEYTVSVTLTQFNEMVARQKNIQDILPEHSADEREFLLSGMTPAEWDHNFPKDEEE